MSNGKRQSDVVRPSIKGCSDERSFRLCVGQFEKGRTDRGERQYLLQPAQHTPGSESGVLRRTRYHRGSLEAGPQHPQWTLQSWRATLLLVWKIDQSDTFPGEQFRLCNCANYYVVVEGMSRKIVRDLSLHQSHLGAQGSYKRCSKIANTWRNSKICFSICTKCLAFSYILKIYYPKDWEYSKGWDCTTKLKWYNARLKNL